VVAQRATLLPQQAKARQSNAAAAVAAEVAVIVVAQRNQAHPSENPQAKSSTMIFPKRHPKKSNPFPISPRQSNPASHNHSLLPRRIRMRRIRLALRA
jgi:hypothetical protein